MNYTIILALFIQGFISKVNRIAGAIAGFFITTGITIWGVIVYGDGDELVFLDSISIPAVIFFGFCIIWLIVDICDIFKGVAYQKQLRETLDGPILQDSAVVRFYQTTQSEWLAGALTSLGPGFAKNARKSYEGFVKMYLPTPGSALHAFFAQYPPQDGEYLIGIGTFPKGDNPGWFVLTNKRLIQRDGADDRYKEIVLDQVLSCCFSKSAKKLTCTLVSGGEITATNVLQYPLPKFFEFASGKPLTVIN